MARRIFSALALLALTAALPAAAAPRPAGDAGAGSSDQRHSVAVIVGNRDYGGDVPAVDFAHNDAAAVRRLVVGRLGYRPGNIIDLRDATLAQLRRVFGGEGDPRGRLHQWVRPGRSDVVVFYAGHGVPGLRDRRSYLLPVDGDPSRAELSGYPLELLYRNLRALPARRVTVLLDACFSGQSPGGSVLREASGLVLSGRDPAGHGLIVLSAARDDQMASWDGQAGHGLFTLHLLHALRGAADGADWGDGDGQVTLGEVRRYLMDELVYAARRQHGRDQVPQIRGRDDVVLARVAVAPRPPAPSAGPAAGTRPAAAAFRDRLADGRPCPFCPDMVVAPPGRFLMGTAGADWARHEGPAREVRLQHRFAIGRYEITFAQWDACAADGGCNGYRPRDQGWGRGPRPVINVSRDDDLAFAAWLNRRLGLAGRADRYRLPSEAEWEYAARAGSTQPFWWGAAAPACTPGARSGARFAGGTGCGAPGTAAVGSFAANGFGLYDVHGNVREWTADCWHDSYDRAPSDGSAWTRGGDCIRRVLRGGSWRDQAGSLRAAWRTGHAVGLRRETNGFRLARSLPESP